MNIPFKDLKYVVFRGEIHPIFLSPEDNLWRSWDGTVFGLTDTGDFTVTDPRVGVGIFSFPRRFPLTKYAKIHDYTYSSPAYQAFHTRLAADRMLRDMIALEPTWYRVFAKPFYRIVRVFGGLRGKLKLWENPKTR